MCLSRFYRRLTGSFFFSSRRRHTRYIGDWSSDVCSSDLPPAAVAEPTPPGPVEAPPVTAPDTLRLAREIETPLRERAAAKREPPKQEPTRAPKLAAALPALPKGTVDKRDRVYSAAQTADAQFRRAAVLLNQGRLSEAEDHLAGALRADPSHAAARQTYVAMLLEQRRVEAARRLLQEALAVNAAQPAFAVALASIYTEQRDYRKDRKSTRL